MPDPIAALKEALRLLGTGRLAEAGGYIDPKTNQIRTTVGGQAVTKSRPVTVSAQKTPSSKEVLELRKQAFKIGEEYLGKGGGDLLVALIQQESGFNPYIKGPVVVMPDGSRVQAVGLGQIIEGTAQALGVQDRTNPEQSMLGAALYLGQMLTRYGGDERKALAAYNAGPGAVDGFIARYGDNWEDALTGGYSETKNYLAAISGPKAPTLTTEQKLEAGGFTKLPDGRYVNTITGAIIDLSNDDLIPMGNRLLKKNPDGSISVLYDGTARSASEEAASNASADANSAQAEKTRADIARDKFVADAISAGKLYPTEVEGVYLTPTGQLVDRATIKIAQGQLDEAKRTNLIKEAAEATRLGIEQQNANTSRLGTEGGLANERIRLGIDQQQADQSGAYQTGMLANDAGRLTLDRAKAAADIAGEQQRNLLAKGEFERQVLSNPADFVAGAFMQRGETMPGKALTSADILNSMNDEYSRLQPGQVLAPPVPPGVPRLAQGGMVRDRLAIVGDSQMPGVPNPEVIHNPTGAPISVTPMNRLSPGVMGGMMPQYANGTGQPNPAAAQVDPAQKEAEMRAKSLGRLLQYVENPETQHQLVDELAQARGRLQPTQPSAPVPAYANGTPSAGSLGLSGREADYYNFQSTAPTPTSPVVDPYAGNWADKLAAGNWGGVTTPPPKSPPVFPPSFIDYGGIEREREARERAQGQWELAEQRAREARDRAKLTLPTPTLAPRLTQDGIVQAAERLLPPALRQLFGDNFGKVLPTQNTTPNPRQPGGITPGRLPFALFTPQQLQSLTPRELTALDSYLAVKYNTTLEDVVSFQKQAFGTPANQRTGRLING